MAWRSLQALQAKRPECALPPRIPATHREEHGVAEETAAAETQAAQTLDSNNDVPPPIPNGYERVTWEVGDLVSDFLIWTKLGRGRNVTNSWHRAYVTKFLSGTGQFTHDARFSDGVRGVQLTEDIYNTGCWLPIARREQDRARARATPRVPAAAPAAARAAAPAAAHAAAPTPAPAVTRPRRGNAKRRGAAAHPEPPRRAAAAPSPSPERQQPAKRKRIRKWVVREDASDN